MKTTKNIVNRKNRRAGPDIFVSDGLFFLLFVRFIDCRVSNIDYHVLNFDADVRIIDTHVLNFERQVRFSDARVSTFDADVRVIDAHVRVIDTNVYAFDARVLNFDAHVRVGDTRVFGFFISERSKIQGHLKSYLFERAIRESPLPPPPLLICYA